MQKKNAAQILASPNKYCNLLTSKMGKTWHFIFATVDTLKQFFLLQQGHKNKTQINYSLIRAMKTKPKEK
jgi:hypothetical protein